MGCSAVSQMSTKSDELCFTYCGSTICNMAAVRHLGFSKLSFRHSTSVVMPFCFPAQNFTDVGQSAVELWPKSDLYRRRPPYRIFRFFFYISSCDRNRVPDLH